ncbi:MAG TPA: protease modulator HflC [Dongiaceae bacterium]|jgi:membrane protease subunit HflC|nr:protease modulator HflC [Dongiaceae bacterium]
MNRSLIIGIVAIVVIAFVVNASSFIVNQAEAVIVTRLGEPKEVIQQPGLYFKVPVIDTIAARFSKRVLNFDAPEREVLTSDQKRVRISAFVRYQITDPYTFYRVGRTTQNAENQIASVLISTLRTRIGNVAMQNILTPQRAALMGDITQELTRQAAAPYGIKIVDVRFKRVDLPPENSETIFNQMRTQRAQEAAGIRADGDREARELRAEADKQQIVTLSDARRQSEILRGEGDAEATRIYNAAFGQDPQFFDFYRSMQAMQDGLRGDNTTFVGSPTGDFFRFFGQEAPQGPAAPK